MDTSQGNANLLNNFFFGCFNRCCPPLKNKNAETSPRPNLLSQRFPQHLLCQEDTIANLLASLDVSKATGVDSMNAESNSSQYCSKLLNSSLCKGVVPSEWKLGRIVPISKTDCSNTLRLDIAIIYPSYQLLVKYWNSM